MVGIDRLAAVDSVRFGVIGCNLRSWHINCRSNVDRSTDIGKAPNKRWVRVPKEMFAWPKRNWPNSDKIHFSWPHRRQSNKPMCTNNRPRDSDNVQRMQLIPKQQRPNKRRCRVRVVWTHSAFAWTHAHKNRTSAGESMLRACARNGNFVCSPPISRKLWPIGENKLLAIVRKASKSNGKIAIFHGRACAWTTAHR